MTCTDAPVLCGTYPEKCFSLYGSMPLRARYLHEQSLRILLHAIGRISCPGSLSALTSGCPRSNRTPPTAHRQHGTAPTDNACISCYHSCETYHTIDARPEGEQVQAAHQALAIHVRRLLRAGVRARVRLAG